MIDYNIISTGSCGNAVILNKTILIDIGVSFRSLRPYYKDLQLVLLTHIHSDHFNRKTVSRLAKERPMLRFGCCEWMMVPLMSCGVQMRNIDVYNCDTGYDYGKIKITPVELVHNVPNCGYKFDFGDWKAMYATDTSTLTGIEAFGYDLYMIEANYDNEEIGERIKQKENTGKYVYEYDVLDNHLSKEACDEFLRRNMSWNSTFVYMHQHKDK